MDIMVERREAENFLHSDLHHKYLINSDHVIATKEIPIEIEKKD